MNTKQLKKIFRKLFLKLDRQNKVEIYSGHEEFLKSDHKPLEHEFYLKLKVPEILSEHELSRNKFDLVLEELKEEKFLRVVYESDIYDQEDDLVVEIIFKEPVTFKDGALNYKGKSFNLTANIQADLCEVLFLDPKIKVFESENLAHDLYGGEADNRRAEKLRKLVDRVNEKISSEFKIKDCIKYGTQRIIVSF